MTTICAYRLARSRRRMASRITRIGLRSGGGEGQCYEGEDEPGGHDSDSVRSRSLVVRRRRSVLGGRRCRGGLVLGRGHQLTAGPVDLLAPGVAEGRRDAGVVEPADEFVL